MQVKHNMKTNILFWYFVISQINVLKYVVLVTYAMYKRLNLTRYQQIANRDGVQ